MLEYQNLTPSTKKLLIKFTNKWGSNVCISGILQNAPSEYALRKYMRNFPARWASYEAACAKKKVEEVGSEEEEEHPTG